MPGGHHHGTADVHLESVEVIRHGTMHTVSLLTINIALEGIFSQVLKQIYPSVASSNPEYQIEYLQCIYHVSINPFFQGAENVEASRFHNET
jgi:hypothetical protein